MARQPRDTTTAAERRTHTGTPGNDTPGGEGRRAVFRVPGPALLAVFLLLVCVIPAATALPGLQVLFVLPLGLAVWVVRTRTTATRQGLTVRTVIGTRELPWEALKGLSITPKSKVNAVLADESTVPLPAVRARHLPVLSLVSEGRLPDPSGVLDEPSTETPAGEETETTGDDGGDTGGNAAGTTGTTGATEPSATTDSAEATGTGDTAR